MAAVFNRPAGQADTRTEDEKNTSKPEYDISPVKE